MRESEAQGRRWHSKGEGRDAADATRERTAVRGLMQARPIIPRCGLRRRACCDEARLCRSLSALSSLHQ